MPKKIFLLLWLVPALAMAAPYVRQHEDTIQNDKKILASDLNDEFDAIEAAVNAIDSSNIVDGSLTTNDFAATSSAISLNKRTGCALSTVPAIGNKSVSILPPCEIFMDGYRGFMTATQTITLNANLHDGSLAAANFYYVYATMGNANLSFYFSQTPPNVISSRKIGDSNSRYIGSVRTQDATQDVAAFTNQRNYYYWLQTIVGTTPPSSGLIATANAAAIFGNQAVTPNFSIPDFWQDIRLKYSAYVGGFPAQCEFDFGLLPSYQAVIEATGGHTGLVPFSINRQTVNGAGTFSVSNIKNCFPGADVRIVGWGEPDSLYQ